MITRSTMAEMLVHATGRIGDDAFKDAKLPKRGHVITIQEDGWPWGRNELDGSDYVVVKCPGIAVAALAQFMAPELPTEPLAPFETSAHLTNVLQPRAFRFDLDNPSVPKGAVVTLRVPLAALTGMLRLAIPRRQHPNVIG